jgi:hypothetical protein
MDGPQLVVLIGAPRSGTTWLQRSLASDPRVVSPQETDLFSKFVAPLDGAWRRSLRGGPQEWAQRRFKGLPAVMSEEDFTAAVRSFVATTFDAVAALKPSASVVVEKSPSHSLHAPLIVRYAPAARFVHIIRDGRDVAASLLAASSGWGSSWAPQSVRAAARTWREHVERGREAADVAPYLEVRYEALRGDTAVEELRRVFAFCGCEVSADNARALVAQNTAEVSAGRPNPIVFGGVGREPEGFVRMGAEPGWHAWSVQERVAFADEAGDLLEQLAYADGSWIGEPALVRAARRRASGRRLAGRVLRRIGSRLRRAGEGLLDRP